MIANRYTLGTAAMVAMCYGVLADVFWLAAVGFVVVMLATYWREVPK